MGYQYDIFLSYSRSYPHGEWVNEIFLPLFQSYISDAINKKVVIFHDKVEVRNGDDFERRIKNSLSKSRVMVSILSPSYFQSPWCMREFSNIYLRQIEYGFLSDCSPAGLIAPIRLFDGEHFPEYVSRLQMLNCVEYFRVGPGVKNTHLYVELQGLLQKWVYDVALLWEKAPVYDEKWIMDDFTRVVPF